MRGRLPDEILLSHRRGLQAADLVGRLRHCADEVEDALAELETGPASAYLDIGHMRESWTTIRREDTADTYRQAVSVLTRGIMGGLFANAVVRGELPGEQTPREAGVLERTHRRD
jgi:asparagine synthase (glutamine-hydrolysing)